MSALSGHSRVWSEDTRAEQAHFDFQRVLAQSDNFEPSYVPSDELVMSAASDVTHVQQGGEQHGQGEPEDDSAPTIEEVPDWDDDPEVLVKSLFWKKELFAHELQVQDEVHEEAAEVEGVLCVASAGSGPASVVINGLRFTLILLSDLPSVCCFKRDKQRIACCC